MLGILGGNKVASYDSTRRLDGLSLGAILVRKNRMDNCLALQEKRFV